MVRHHLVVLFLCLHQLPTAFSLDNGVALTPPMGWMSWTRYYCEVDCVKHPNACINEDLYLRQGRALVQQGYAALGYNRIHIDDCWMSDQRTPDGRLTANATRFPHGIPWLVQQLADIGINLAIYEDYGTKTCGGYPGSLGYLQQDANTFAQWGVDYLKLDGCYADETTYERGYEEMTHALNATGKAIIYSCSYPAYLSKQVQTLNYQQLIKACNLWRNYNDISLHWESLADIIDWFTKNQNVLIPANGPGHWNDPDMIIGGNPEISDDASRAQMTIWAIWSAPLIMSNNLDNVTPSQKAILQNRAVIEIDQDPLGIMGTMVKESQSVRVYSKLLSRTSIIPGNGSIHWSAIGVLNTADFPITAQIKFGPYLPTRWSFYDIYDAWNDNWARGVDANQFFTVQVPARGAALVRLTPVSRSSQFTGKRSVRSFKNVESSASYVYIS